MSDETRGLYGKYRVTRTDGSHGKGKRHEYCKYFVIDLQHDRFAAEALLAYASACEHEFPALASDLRRMIAGEGHALNEFDGSLGAVRK